jgi:hypothetical protein
MRLINTQTLHLEEFLDDKIPEYAILSHTWCDEEVTLQDIKVFLEKEKGGVCEV